MHWLAKNRQKPPSNRVNTLRTGIRSAISVGMRFLFVSPLILHFLLSFEAKAASCEVASVKDQAGQSRLYKIQFPDGRKLSVAGHIHTNRNAMWEMMELPESKNLFENVRTALSDANSRAALIQFEEDRKFLRDAIKNDGAEFIGLELSDGRVGEWWKKNRLFQDRLLRHSARTGESDVDLISKARLAAYGAPLAMPLEEPALFVKAPLYGFEDDQAIKKHHEVSLPLSQLVAEARGEIKEREWRDKLDRLGETLQLEHYPLHDPEAPKAEIIKPWLSQWPGKYRQIIRDVLLVYMFNFDVMYDRDVYSAENILKKNKSGIVFAGASHAKTLMLRLREACLKQQLQSEDLTSAIPASTHR